MKKSELKKYVRENIISELSESTEDEINKTKELTQAVQDLESAKKEAGIEEGAIDPAEYGDIGVTYLKGFNKPHSLNLDQLEKLGREIVKRLYKGDFAAAKAKFIKEDLKEGNFDELKKYQKMLDDAAKFFREKADEYGVETKTFGAFNKGINDLETAIFDEDNKRSGGKIDENEDEDVVKYKGEDKDKLVKILKDKTKLKKELESILDK